MTRNKENEMSKKSNTARVLPDLTQNVTQEIAPVSVPQVSTTLDDKGRIRLVQMSLVEWDDICKAKGLDNTSKQIRYLIAQNYSPAATAKFLGKLYQHVRNVMNQQLKRPVVAPPATTEGEGDGQ